MKVLISMSTADIMIFLCITVWDLKLRLEYIKWMFYSLLYLGGPGVCRV